MQNWGISYEEMAVLFPHSYRCASGCRRISGTEDPVSDERAASESIRPFYRKDICAYFRLALGNIERNDLLQVMNRPKRYIGRDSVASGETFF